MIDLLKRKDLSKSMKGHPRGKRRPSCTRTACIKSTATRYCAVSRRQIGTWRSDMSNMSFQSYVVGIHKNSTCFSWNQETILLPHFLSKTTCPNTSSSTPEPTPKHASRPAPDLHQGPLLEWYMYTCYNTFRKSIYDSYNINWSCIGCYQYVYNVIIMYIWINTVFHCW